MGKKKNSYLVSMFLRLKPINHNKIAFFSSKPDNKCTSASQRDRLSEKKRVMNRARKSYLANRLKKVFSSLNELSTVNNIQEYQIKQIEDLISLAYSGVDKAIQKNTIHLNTGKRRKSRIAQAKKNFLIQTGLYVQ